MDITSKISDLASKEHFDHPIVGITLSNPDIPVMTVQSSRLGSVLPKKNPTAHSSGLSSDTSKASANTFPDSKTEEPTGYIPD